MSHAGVHTVSRASSPAHAINTLAVQLVYHKPLHPLHGFANGAAIFAPGASDSHHGFGDGVAGLSRRFAEHAAGVVEWLVCSVGAGEGFQGLVRHTCREEYLFVEVLWFDTLGGTGAGEGRKWSKMDVMTLVFFAGGFFGQLSIVVIRLRAILKFTSQLLTCVHLPLDCEFSFWTLRLL